MSGVAMRLLRATDLSMLSEWLATPHLKPFYMRETMSEADVRAKFLPRLSSAHSVRCLIAEEHGRPFGYVQWYYNRSFPDYGAAAVGRDEGVSLDYFIGDPTFLGRGLGTRMLVECVRLLEARLAPPDRTPFILHDDRNRTARRCTERAGFNRVQGLEKDGFPHSLYCRALDTVPSPDQAS